MIEWLFGFDPTGMEAMVLCILTCSVFISLMVAGFILICRYGRSTPAAPKRSARRPYELDLLTLWRLDRQQRATAASNQGAETATDGLVRR